MNGAREGKERLQGIARSEWQDQSVAVAEELLAAVGQAEGADEAVHHVEAARDLLVIYKEEVQEGPMRDGGRSSSGQSSEVGLHLAHLSHVVEKTLTDGSIDEAVARRMLQLVSMELSRLQRPYVLMEGKVKMGGAMGWPQETSMGTATGMGGADSQGDFRLLDGGLDAALVPHTLEGEGSESWTGGEGTAVHLRAALKQLAMSGVGDPSVKMLKCERCNKKFSKFGFLARHVEKGKCQQKGRQLEGGRLLEGQGFGIGELASHNGGLAGANSGESPGDGRPTKRMFKCRFCGEEFKALPHLSLHWKEFHPDAYAERRAKKLEKENRRRRKRGLPLLPASAVEDVGSLGGGAWC